MKQSSQRNTQKIEEWFSYMYKNKSIHKNAYSNYLSQYINIRNHIKYKNTKHRYRIVFTS